jgi:hypothetical protein
VACSISNYRVMITCQETLLIIRHTAISPMSIIVQKLFPRRDLNCWSPRLQESVLPTQPKCYSTRIVFTFAFFQDGNYTQQPTFVEKHNKTDLFYNKQRWCFFLEFSCFRLTTSPLSTCIESLLQGLNFLFFKHPTSLIDLLRVTPA